MTIQEPCYVPLASRTSALARREHPVTATHPHPGPSHNTISDLARRRTVPPRNPAPRVFERAFPGDPAVGSLLRVILAKFLLACPAADDVIALAWELAANAIAHSDSRLPGGRFTITIHDFPDDYIYADVRDEGGQWDADLEEAAQWPHGLYLLKQLAAAYGAAGGRRSWRVWFTIPYPSAGCAAANPPAIAATA